MGSWARIPDLIAETEVVDLLRGRGRSGASKAKAAASAAAGDSDVEIVAGPSGTPASRT